MELLRNNRDLDTKSNISNLLISTTINSILDFLNSGELKRAEQTLKSLLKTCDLQGRLPQLNIHLEKCQELKCLDFHIDPFLSKGELTQETSISKIFKLFSKEEIFYFVEAGIVTWNHARSFLFPLTGRYHDIRPLKLFLVFCLLEKERLVDAVRLLLKRYPSLSRMCFDLLDQEQRESFKPKEQEKIKKIKVIKKRFNFDFPESEEGTTTKKKIQKKQRETKSEVDEIIFLEQFVKISNTYHECLDSLLLNQFYLAADFYLKIVSDKLPSASKSLYLVEILRGLGEKNRASEYIKKNKLINNSNISLGRHYYKLLNSMHENK